MKVIKKIVLPVAIIGGVVFIAVKKFGIVEKVKGLFKKGDK